MSDSTATGSGPDAMPQPPAAPHAGPALHDLGPLEPLVAVLADALRGRGARLATAESCTGGLIAAACTAVAGSSDWFERSVVSYSNEAKTELLGVDAGLIAQHGAVSEPVARAMAAGMLGRSRAEVAVAVTGIAGPGGGSAAKPVGLVWFAWAWRVPGTAAPQVEAAAVVWPGDRAVVRGQTVRHALEGVVERLGRGA